MFYQQLKNFCWKIITVFDAVVTEWGKRPIMGRISSELSDFTIITSDNLVENPETIIEEIESGVIEIIMKNH